MDMSILRDLFDQTAQASAILGLDADFRQEIFAKRAGLAPFQIGKYGQLQEWIGDKDDPKNDHRHVSHLYAVFPSNQINASTPALFQAAKRSLIFRGDAGTGWSKAWKINFWARFLDGDHAHKMLTEALVNNTYPNLFDAHPPFKLTVTSARRPASLECFCNRKTANSICFPRYRARGPMVRFADSKRVAGLKWTSRGTAGN
ncbi:hypothetical protein B1R32_11817 [Abditibacterium utsteinense]|uniref:Glycosyl hydrolase family 95 catalytic domain-containing protein n=1 Tax=Abditibacterium utsteinense TaxID=1960156 RepID=A0A2S8SQ44_9BACT|nr:hypothetical protein B1R32_11817 [Abditibacterium utsteinense]